MNGYKTNSLEVGDIPNRVIKRVHIDNFVHNVHCKYPESALKTVNSEHFTYSMVAILLTLWEWWDTCMHLFSFLVEEKISC